MSTERQRPAASPPHQRDPQSDRVSLLLNDLRGRVLRGVLARMRRSGHAWRANFTVAGMFRGTPVRVPFLFGNGFQNLEIGEMWLFDVLQRLLATRPGAFLDVGVNLGQTLLKVKLVDRDRHYVGLEPNPQCVHYAQQLIARNQFPNCTIVPVALSSSHRVLKLFSKADADPSASVVEGFREPHRYSRAQYVPAIEGDELVKTVGLENLAVIKIDVEGGELEVLQGLSQTVRRFQPYILCEVLPVFDPSSAVGQLRLQRQQELQGVLAREGYQIFRCDHTAAVQQLSEFGVHSDMARTNYVFVPQMELPAFNQRFAVTATV